MEGSQIVNKQIWKPIHLSAIKGDEKLLLRILERGQLDRFFPRHAFRLFSRQPNNQGGSIIYLDRTSGLYALTPLHLSALGSYECTKLLLEHQVIRDYPLLILRMCTQACISFT